MPAAAAASSHYIQPAPFTRLFRARRRNRDRIAAELHLLAWRAAGRFHADCHQDLEDAAAAATLTALRKIGHFDSRRKGANAFAYFSTVVIRQIAEELERLRWQRQKDRIIGGAIARPDPRKPGGRSSRVKR